MKVKIEELLPDRWKAAHPQAVREYREQETRDKADTTVVQAARRLMRFETTQRQIATDDLSCKPQLEQILLGAVRLQPIKRREKRSMSIAK